jgi:uncharacterized membrane protein
MNDVQDENLESQNEGSSEKSEESSSLIKTEEVESKIEEIIDAIPEEKREQARHIFREFRETFVGLIDRSPSSKLSPEIATILANSADKDNEFRFKYLTQKQTNEADQIEREHTFRCKKHEDRVSIVKPIVWALLLLVIGCTIAGIWLCVKGYETIGAAILSGAWCAVFGYMAGFGTSNFFKDEKAN